MTLVQVRVFVFALAGVWLGTGFAVAAAPTVSHLFPAGGQRGTKVTVTCTGTFTWPVSVWAPGIEVTPAADSGKLEVTIPPDLAANRVWIRLYNAEGTAAAQPFLIGGLKEVNDQEPNNSPRSAQVLPEPDITINGDLKGGDVDGFAVPLKAGQTLVAALDANSSLGAPTDSILQIVSPEGIVLAENHDDVGLDPRLAYTAAKSGTHIVRLFAFPSNPGTTIAFHGGANCIYRLTITTGPFVTHSVPLAAPLADLKPLDVAGWNVPANTKLPVVPFGGTQLVDLLEKETLADLRNTAETQLGFAFAPSLAGAARIRLVPHPVHPGLAETNPQNPLTLTPPIAATGRLSQPRQVDVFKVPLKKGQQVLATVESKALGFPLDAVLGLADPTGKVLATVDNLNPVLCLSVAHVAAVDGDHQVTIRDRHRRGDERNFYRLSITLEQPDFELTTAADNLVVNPDKPTEFVVNVLRRNTPDGAIGPITVEAVDLPPGVTAPAVVSEASGPTATKVTLAFTSAGPAFSGRIKIRGTAAQPKELKRLARTPLQLGACFDSVWLTAIAKP